MRRLMNLLPTQFLVPSILYAVNNNIYFAGLTLVPPPIWLILCSFRTVVTASLYKVCVCTSLYLYPYVFSEARRNSTEPKTEKGYISLGMSKRVS